MEVKRYIVDGFSACKRAAGRVFPSILGHGGNRKLRRLHYITEDADWVIRRVGEAIVKNLRLTHPQLRCDIARTSKGLHHQLVHFGSIWTFSSGIHKVHRSNSLVVTVYHGREDTSAEMQKALEKLRKHLPRLSAVVTASTLMCNRLLSWGVPADKLHRIPLGVDLRSFTPPPPQARLQIRRRLGVPEGSVCIGSFQKDGTGWREGNEPKLIKGPDIFLEAVKRLSKNYPVFVLLTGPARGYVKRGLEAAGVPYIHEYPGNYDALSSYYHCLDLYLVCAREEGGPLALLECMATGVPLISTRVGMAPDIIEDGANGLLVDIEDTDAIVKAGEKVIENGQLRSQLVTRALRTVKDYDWSTIACAYYEQVYNPLLYRQSPGGVLKRRS